VHAAIERSLNKTWYGTRPPGVVLTGLEKLYRYLSGRQRARSLAQRAADLEDKAIMVVGNLTAGGAGKTPLVLRLCELARDCGLRPGVISRGYGRSSKGAVRVSAAHTAAEAGDEPVLIANRPGVTVMVDANREQAARALFEDGVDVVISDDGLQRLSLPRALEFCVVDEQRGFGNGHLLPAGPLREPVSRLESVDFVVYHLGAGSGDLFDREDKYFMRLKADSLVMLNGEHTMPLAEAADQRVEIHAVAGIAHPARFFETLSRNGIESINHPFPDHHPFKCSDFGHIPQGSMILMTEKDAVKCRDLHLQNAWYAPVCALLNPACEQRIRQYFHTLAKA